jgi:UDP-N-acetylmuramoyl-L-alanyl-D-glutamate--2,6-diaminopimelate ligase
MDKFLYKIKKLIPTKIFKKIQPIYHFFLSWFSALVYGRPSNEIIVIGVTGTTGKTTSVYLIAKTLENAGYKVGYTSTAMFNNGQREWLNDKKMTMIGRFFTQRILRQMVKNGCHYAIVETTSEGVVQNRHRFINYDVLVFTGLYPEHIESHGSFEKYKQAKGGLFKHLHKCQIKYVDEKNKVTLAASGIKTIGLKKIEKTIIVNGDDEHRDYFLNFWADKKIVYSRNKSDDKKVELIKYGDIKADQQGTEFTVESTKILLQLLGEFNVTNAMTAVAVGRSQSMAMGAIKAGLEKIEGVAGRLEKINEGQDFAVIIDYAFEPKAVKKLYETVKVMPHEKIIHVLGSTGGGRDVARRPILGALAGENADFVIVTNEDPYDDDPEIIMDQVALGAEKTGKKINENLFKILDRREAIKRALEIAKKDDIVLITGKGSEQAICLAAGEKLNWDDRAITRGLLTNKN